MAGYNRVVLLGNLTRDPALTYTPNQTAVVDFGLATNRQWTGQDGSKRDETCFVDCRAFGKTAENINKFFSKGRPIFIEGRLTYDSWKKQDGTQMSKLRVTVDTFQFVGGKGESLDGPQQQRGDAQPANQNREPIPDSDFPF